jgi:hypothetical protein
MSTNWADTVTINVRAKPILFSSPEQYNAPLSRFTSEPSGHPSGSPDSEGSTSLLPAVTPLFPPTFPVRSRLATCLKNPLDGLRCSLSLPAPTRARRSYLCRSPSTRSRRTVGDTSIDWIVPESSTTPLCFKGIGKALIRTMQTLTSAAAIRSSVARRCHQERDAEWRRWLAAGTGAL